VRCRPNLGKCIGEALSKGKGRNGEIGSLWSGRRRRGGLPRRDVGDHQTNAVKLVATQTLILAATGVMMRIGTPNLWQILSTFLISIVLVLLLWNKGKDLAKICQLIIDS
jgi:hypothetical protein